MEINYIFYFNSYQSQDRLNQQYNNCTVQLHATYLTFYTAACILHELWYR